MDKLRILSILFALLGPVAAFAQTECPFPAPLLLLPEEGATSVTTPVTFDWTPAAGAIAYEVWVSYDGGEPEKLESTPETHLFDDVPPATSVEWHVVAIFTSCSVRSQSAHFTTGACDPPEAELLAPLDGAATGSPVEFLWSEVEEADRYRLWVDGRVAAETRRTEADVHLTPGPHEWFVETLFDDCGTSISETRTLTVARAADCATTKPALVAPADGATVGSRVVTLSWSEVPDAIGYEIRAALGDGPLELVDETEETSINTRFAEGRITWIVVARFDGCDDAKSDASRFTIPYDPSCDNSAPFPLSPANDADDVPANVDFVWTAVAGAKRYRVFVYPEEGEGEPILAGTTTSTRLTAEVPEGEFGWVVEAEMESCPSEPSPMFVFDRVEPGPCRVPAAPAIFLDPRAESGSEVLLLWSARHHAASYDVQESMRDDFSGATTRTINDVLLTLAHDVRETTRFFYRVRANSSCGVGPGPWSSAASIVITAPAVIASDQVDLAAPYGQQNSLVQKVRVPGSNAPRSFIAKIDQPWLSVTPASGVIAPEGLELTINADPKQLPVGSNAATLTLEYESAARALQTNAGVTQSSVPISVSLVTPVTPNPGNAPPPGSLFIPAVAHAAGAAGRFESDVRIANVSAQLMKYLLLFTPTRSDGTRVGQQATIQVAPGQTAALNDILKNVYGYAKVSDNISGVLEIRPLTPSGESISTFASSRTSARNALGSFGQFIPAISYARFIGNSGGSLLSLQQIAQCETQRTNLGLIEASGEPASVRLSIFDDTGRPAGDFDIALKAGEHMQLGSLLAQHGISMTDGRIEVAVTSSSGKVTAYASVLDNRTNDAMLVTPVDPTKIAESRYIIPGIADFGSRWRSDLRVFNAGTADVTATFTFVPRGNASETRTFTRTLHARQVLSVDDALPSLFNVTNSGGSIVVTTPSASQLVATARTYTQTEEGTFGQFIPGMTIGEGVGLGDRALQLLQIEESDRLRTNVGIVELTGNPVTVEISAFRPDTKIAAVTRVSLEGGELRQVDRILREFGFDTTYNARVTLKVVAGSGKIGGYASLIDNGTNDATYIPGQ